jgi:UDP-N-acetylglucosamine 4-epimerase
LGSSNAAVIPLFVDGLTGGRTPVLHGDGTQSRDFTYIDDMVRAYVLAASADTSRCAGRVYNIAPGIEHTLLELLADVRAILGIAYDPVRTASRPGAVHRSRADASAARRDIGWTAEILFEESLRRITIGWLVPGRRSQR